MLLRRKWEVQHIFAIFYVFTILKTQVFKADYHNEIPVISLIYGPIIMYNIS